MKVQNMQSKHGNDVPNQFIISGTNEVGNFEVLQSYKSVIAKKQYGIKPATVELDETYWDYSRTTSRYRNEFLGETKKETEAKIKSGEYKLVNLNLVNLNKDN